jgi:aspartyl-tRNA synthetase
MSFNPNESVSLEEYNAALRGSVNAYYEHAMNNQTMSKEAVIKSTAEMSEKYLEAVQEFQETQGTQNLTGVAVTDGIQSAESNGTQADTNTVGVLAADNGDVDSGVSGGGICDADSGSGCVDNDVGGVDDGMDI